ncbi:MAG: DUF393 domain-containing protein [Candidatus Latescibacterota bacterium]
MDRITLFYDPACPLCRRLRAWVQHCDGEGLVRLVALDAAELEGEFADLDVSRARRELTALDASGRVWRGLDAVRQVGLRLPGVRRLDFVYRLPGVRRAGGRLYQAVNRRRRGPCRRCGESWMPSDKRRGRRRDGGQAHSA